MISKLSFLLAGSVTAIGVKKKGKCPFGFTSGDKPNGTELAQALEGEPKYPSEILKCSKDKVF